VFALAIGAFGIGTAEFATMGLLPYIADGLGSSITEASHAVSLYAIGVVGACSGVLAKALGYPGLFLLAGGLGLAALGLVLAALRPRSL